MNSGSQICPHFSRVWLKSPKVKSVIKTLGKAGGLR